MTLTTSDLFHPGDERISALFRWSELKGFYTGPLEDSDRFMLKSIALQQYALYALTYIPTGRFTNATSEFVDGLFLACLHFAASELDVSNRGLPLLFEKLRLE